MKRWYRTFGKRLLDLAVTLPALLLALPLLLTLGALVRSWHGARCCSVSSGQVTTGFRLRSTSFGR